MAHLTHGPNYGIVQLEIDGGKWSDPVDLYSNRLMPGGFGWHRVMLEKGRHVLGIRVTGRNPASSGYAFGLDYLKTALGY
jgi:hypothetical protein